jgi:hypothetical protein
MGRAQAYLPRTTIKSGREGVSASSNCDVDMSFVPYVQFGVWRLSVLLRKILCQMAVILVL